MSAIAWATTGELLALVLASYGLLRESFAVLNEGRPYSEGRFGEGTFGGGPSRLTRVILYAATWARLLPGDRKLTLTDRKQNAALAVAGVTLGALCLLVELLLTIAAG